MSRRSYYRSPVSEQRRALVARLIVLPVLLLVTGFLVWKALHAA